MARPAAKMPATAPPPKRRARASGGDDSLDNLALACESCNLYKSDATSGWDDEGGQHIALFHPRRDRWDDHFQVAPESGAMAGRTPIGRATVIRLGLNSAAQVAARLQWMRLGLFP